MNPLLLIIEESENVQHYLAEVCRKALPDSEILTATNGCTGLQLAQIRTPRIVVLNSVLAGLDGFEVCRRIKSDPTTAFIQVLLIADELETESNHAHGANSGVDGFLLKPFNSVELILQVRSLFRWWEAEKKNRDRIEGLVAMRTAALMEGIDRLRQEVAQRRGAEADRDKMVRELQHALSEVKTLRGLLPMCCNCKKIRDNQGLWNEIEQYILQHSEAQLTHGICPDCVKALYPNLFHDKEVKLLHASKRRCAVEQPPCETKGA